MKFEQIDPFMAYVKRDRFPLICALVVPKISERKKIFREFSHFLGVSSDCLWATNLTSAFAHLQGGSLFAPRVAAICQEIDGSTKDEGAALVAYVASPNERGHLLIGANGLKIVGQAYRKAAKGSMVLLDLSAEKPWDERVRFEKWVDDWLKTRGKRCSPKARGALFDRIPLDKILIENELEKLICYLGERVELTEGDVEILTPFALEANLFQLAEALIWGKEGRAEIDDPNLLFPLLGILRMQLEMGLKIGGMIQKNVPLHEIQATFPSVRSKKLQERLNLVNELKVPFFLRGLSALFDLEYNLKTTSLKPRLLFARFCAVLERK